MKGVRGVGKAPEQRVARSEKKVSLGERFDQLVKKMAELRGKPVQPELEEDRYIQILKLLVWFDERLEQLEKANKI